MDVDGYIVKMFPGGREIVLCGNCVESGKIEIYSLVSVIWVADREVCFKCEKYLAKIKEMKNEETN